METILVILPFLIVTASLVGSFVAIIQILSNDFKGSKGLWIIISMIGFIGPILWLTKGRKLIVKLSAEERLEIKNSFSAKSHYKELAKGVGLLFKALVSITAAMILTGCLVRALDLYFFWESKTIGYVLLLILLAVFLWQDIIGRKAKNVKRIWSNIIFVLICFMLFVKGLIMVILPLSGAYSAAKEQLINNAELTSEIGQITGFFVLPSGSMQSSTDASGTYGTASLELIIKGTNKYVERSIYLEKLRRRIGR